MSVNAIPEGSLLLCDLCAAEEDHEGVHSPEAVREYANIWGWYVPSPHDDPDDDWSGKDVCPDCVHAAAHKEES